jgi:hypothetical protein
LAHTYSIPGGLLAFFTVGLAAWVIAAAAELTCGDAVIGLAAGLIAFLIDFEYWFYHERLMCIRPNQCVVGTVTIAPRPACDGDNKIDTLIAPFGFFEADGSLLVAAVNALVAAGTITPPAAGLDIAANRADRVSYVAGLPADQGRLLYMELVHNHMLNDPARNFQGHFFRREAAAMPVAAFNNTPDDAPGDANHNPMFRFETDAIGGPGVIDKFFCQVLLGVDDDEPPAGRLVPFMHCEIEGNRLSRALTNLKISIVTFAVAYVIACAICEALTAGAGGFLCRLIAGAIAALFAWLIWLISKLFNDPDDGEVHNIPVDQADPTAADPTTTGARGDVVLIFGDWIKDTEHKEYFELHPVKAWFLICRDPAGAVGTVDDPTVPNCGFDVTTFTEMNLLEMCKLVTTAELSDPPGSDVGGTSAGLSKVGGIARRDDPVLI